MKFLAFATAALMMSAGSAHAATIFTDRAAFDAATTGATSRSFPSSAINTASPAYTFNNVAFNTALAGDRSMVQDGLFQNAVYLATALGGSVTISSTLNAIGLYLGSADGVSSFGYNANGTAGTFTTLVGTNNGGKFIGFLDTSPISVTFNIGSGREFDIVSYVTTTNPVTTPTPTPVGSVPEPATWAMMMLGFGGMGYAMRRKAKVSTRIRFA